MSNIVDLDKVRKKLDEITKADVDKRYQNIVEDLVSSMMDNGIDFNQRTERATVLLLKIIESLLYTQQGIEHKFSEQVDDFIKNAFKK